MTIFLVAPIIVFLFIPLYRKLNVTTAYQYLELRFNIVVRSIGSLSFILFQIGRMGVVLFLPSIALNVVTGIDIFVCIALMGIVSLLYTMMGGIEAVIWTDVMQVIVLLGGALLSLALMISAIDGGFQTIVDTAMTENKFNAFDLTWSLRQPGVSVAIQVVVGYYQPVHLLLFASTGVLSCYISGYVASLIFTNSAHTTRPDLIGLNIRKKPGW